MLKTIDAPNGGAWRAASYERLSRDDENVGESNSIVNQRNIIADFAAERSDITLVQDYCDDGYSGSNFERPGFKEMLDALSTREVDAIIVKDLSRFGRNYLEMGYYLDRLLPQMGVRVIAIADNYDSVDSAQMSDSIMIPFKNLMNDFYCRDVSTKIKTQLVAKRKRGECVSPCLPYGYLKDETDKSKIVVDPQAAAVVRDIFKWRLKGMNAEAIATKLNDNGTDTPFMHMRSLGLRPSDNFKRSGKDAWSARVVIRILANEMYLGTLVQGKTYKPDFRSKTVVARPESEWERCEGSHEAIVDERTFKLVQDLSARDTRTSPGKKGLGLLAGFVFCADCGSTMARRKIRRGEHEYVYYTCMGHRHDCKSCTTHNINGNKLVAAVERSIRERMAAALDDGDVEGKVKQASRTAQLLADLQGQERALVARIERIASLKRHMYEDYADEVLSKEEFLDFSKAYDHEVAQQKKAMAQIAERASALRAEPDNEYLDALARHRDFEELDRLMLMELIDRINIHEGGIVEIVFLFHELGTTGEVDVNALQKGGEV